MNDERSPIILFDGVCNLCNGAVQFVIKRDPRARFRFASLQSDAAIEILKKLRLSDNPPDSFVLVLGHKYYLRSTAALNVLKELGGFWKIFYSLIIVPRPVRDWIYNLIARSRYRIFGRRNECMIPRPELQDRFL